MANNENEAGMNKEKRYNGWTNYETWAVALWLDNDAATHNYWREEAARHVQEAADCEMVQKDVWTAADAARFNLAEQLNDEMTDASPLEDPSVYSDLLQAALDEVDWKEIAENMIGDLDS